MGNRKIAERAEHPVLMDDLMYSILPEHISQASVVVLAAVICERILCDPEVKDALEACELQPTSRAASLAAMSAVNVLLAHEIGQEVAADMEQAEAEQETKP